MATQQPLRPLEGNQKSKLPYVLVGVLIVAVCFVVFVLPKSVDAPDQVRASDDELPPANIRNEPSPLEMAELRQARSEAQSLLKDILPLRDSLLNMNVQAWAAAPFDSALAEIETGERLYARGQYRESINAYRSGYTELKAINDGIPERVEKNLEIGNAALEQFNTEEALQAYERVLLIQPDNDVAVAGLARAKKLPETIPLWQQAQVDFSNAAWSSAKENLQNVLDLDPYFPEAEETLKIVQSRLRVDAFTNKMSQGFSALGNGALDQAERAFNEALSLKPDNDEAMAALAQVKTAQVNRSIATDLSEAQALEQQESWQQAVQLYDEILKRHPGLAEVKASRLPASIRAQIDQNFDEIMSDPLKLGESGVYDRANRLLSDMKSLSAPGQKLTNQIATLEGAITRARTPVEVTLLSDNATNVEVFRIGQFGAISKKTLRLTPGHYIASGNRLGFRDVQIKFTIDGIKPVNPIEVICTEPI